MVLRTRFPKKTTTKTPKKPRFRFALKNGEVSEDILKKYLLQIPGVSIDEKGVVKGLKDVTATPFNNAMKTLQKEEGINLGY